jgi:uncharacterized protein YuzE
MSATQTEWVIPDKIMPSVRIDTEAESAYVLLSGECAIAETRLVRDDEIVVTVDLNERGEVIGFEVVGTKEFTLDALLSYAEIPAHYFDRARWHTRYLSA